MESTPECCAHPGKCEEEDSLSVQLSCQQETVVPICKAEDGISIKEHLEFSLEETVWKCLCRG